MSDTTQRDRVMRLAKTDWESAFSLAKSIKDGWYSAQAFAAVARYAPETKIISMVETAVAAIAFEKDPFRRVAPMAWSIRALVERGRTADAIRQLHLLMPAIDAIMPSASRSEALFLLFQALLPAGIEATEPLLKGLLQVTNSSAHWREHRNVVDTICMLHACKPAFAAEKLADISDEKLREKIQRSISIRPSMTPCPFFF